MARPSRLDAQADSAVQAWLEAELEWTSPFEERQAAVRRFSAIANQFVMGSLDALDGLVERLSRSGPDARRALARLLTAIPDPRAEVALLAAHRSTQSAELDASTLAYLGTAAPLSSAAWDYWPSARQHERAPLLRALLRRPSPEANALLAGIVVGDDLDVLRDALQACERWVEPEVLRAIVEGPELRRSDQPEWVGVDVRLDAAFLLGMRGDDRAARRLLELASPPDSVRSAHACVRLARLGLPSAAALTEKLLASSDPFAIGLALDAAEALRSAALIEPLLDLAKRLDTAPDVLEGSSLADDALRVAASIAGAPSPEEVTLHVCLDACRERARALALEQRYSGGKLLSVRRLVDDLLSPHSGPRAAAAANLRAATGLDHGYAPESDLVANLTAIERWRAIAEGADLLPPGSWAWQGRVIGMAD